MSKKIKLLSTYDLCLLLKLKRRAIYARLEKDILPKPVYQNEKIYLWDEKDILKYMTKNNINIPDDFQSQS